MNLSSDLISQFVKITKDTAEPKKETNTYGTIVKKDGEELKVKLIGSPDGVSTPVRSTEVDVEDGDKVSVTIRDHSIIVTGNLTSPSARSGTIYEKFDKVSADYGEFTKLVADELVATNARIDNLDVTELKADYGEFKTLVASDFEAVNARIDKLDVGVLDADIASIKELIFGSATGDTIQTSFSNAVIAQLGDAQIKSAMIESVSASKITAGDIITNNVQVMSDDGKLLIYDGTIQISDGSRVRVQIGEDDSGDYSINIWDANGNLMFSKGGITDSAIKEAIIRNDMISDTANISAYKLDIDSLFEEMNDNDACFLLSSKVYFSDKEQTLDVAFKSLTTEVTNHGETITSQGTQISTIQGQITNKIWQQDITKAKNELGEQTEALNTKYSELNQTVYGISTTVASHTTDMSKLETRMSTVEQTADGLVIRLNGVDDDISEAGKTATNYMSATTSGIIVGDMTTDALGNNVLIDSDSIDIRNGETVYASFGANLIELGKNGRNAKIDLCNGLATLYHESKYSYDTIFVIDTGNTTEIMGLINPLCVTSVDDLDQVSIQFANSNGVMGGVGIIGSWLRRFGSNMYDAYTILDSGNFHDVMDSGWKSGGAIGEDFTLYDDNYQIQYRKIGKIVEIRGIVQPAKAITGSTENHLIFTLAQGYRPSKYLYERCQGSGAYSWLLSIATNGEVRFARYNDGSQWVEASTESWLPFHITFFVD